MGLHRWLPNVKRIGFVIFMVTLFLFPHKSIHAQQGEVAHKMTNIMLQERFYKTEIDEKISVDIQGATIEESLRQIANATGLKLAYRGDIIEDKMITLRREISITDALDYILNETGLDYLFSQEGYLLIYASRDDLSEIQFQQDINGTVTDADTGEPLPGVNVIVAGSGSTGSTIGTTTDMDGNYEIQVPDDSNTLVFSYIGYQRMEVQIDGRTEIDVELSSDVQMLEDIVVVGYGTQRRQDLTGSISTVDTEEFQYTPKRNISSLLQGSVAGVNVVKSPEPGGENIVRIRGSNSMLGGNDPLYVVDGFPGGTIGDPSNIESIEVLKDASATAIYGARGANGVIIVTTKRGSESPMISINMDYGIQRQIKKLDLLNAQEYAKYANKKAENIGSEPYFQNPNNLPGNTDWQDEIFRPAPTQNYDITISGGDNNNSYAVLGNYTVEEGIINTSAFEKGNLKLNLDNDINDWFSISTSLLASIGMNEQSPVFPAIESLTTRTLLTPPVAPVRNESGDYFSLGNLPGSDPVWQNPKAIIEGRNQTIRDNRFEGNTRLQFNLLDNLEFNVRAGASYSNSRQDVYNERIIQEGGSAGTASVNEFNSYRYLVDGIFSYIPNIGNSHSLEIDAGLNWEENIDSNFGVNASDFVKDNLKTNNLNGASEIGGASSFKSQNTLMSGIGRINYRYDDRYLLTITTRADGSSRFGANNKWGFFPSMALGWRLSEEDFLQEVDYINDLKLRASYGLTGNQSIGNYQSLSRLNTTLAIFGVSEERSIGFAPVVLENPDLKWEVTKQLNIGVDFSTFNQRLDLTFDYYKKETEDLLASVPLAASSGFTSILKNFGAITNEGFEVGFNNRIVENQNVSLSVGGNIGLNRNEVISVANESGEFFASQIFQPVSARVNIIKEGHPLSSFYGFREDGLWESDQGAESIQPGAKAGDQKYVDLNADGIINEDDKEILGSPFPDFTYGINMNFSYRNFDFNMLLQGVHGGLVFNGTNFTIADNFARNGNQLREAVEKSYTAQNQDPNAEWPRLSDEGPLPSERYFEDGSYLRFKTLSLGYNIPSSLLGWLNDARIFITAENYFTITNYSGIDPEISSDPGNSLRKSVDFGTYPPAKILTFGINVNI